MLIITRKQHQTVQVGHHTSVTVLQIKDHQVKLGFVAPEDVRIYPGEAKEKVANAVRDILHVSTQGSWMGQLPKAPKRWTR